MTSNNHYQTKTDNHSDLLASRTYPTILNLFKAIVHQEKPAAKAYQAIYHRTKWESKKDLERLLYGVVIEVGESEETYHLLTVYSDYCASYVDATGKLLLWERPDGEFDALIDELLEAARPLLEHMPIWDDEFLEPVHEEQVRIHLLTSQGMYSAEASIIEMSTSPLGEEIMRVQAKLAQWLVYYYENSMEL